MQKQILNKSDIFDADTVQQINALNLQNAKLYQRFNKRQKTDFSSVLEEINQAVTHLYGHGAEVKDKEAHLIMGPPGSGKTTVLTAELCIKRGALEIDADIAKPYFQEYQNGIGAGAVHEGSGVAAEIALNMAKRHGDNLVQSLIGKNLQGVRNKINTLKEAGYTVYLHLLDISPEQSAFRVWARYQETGRYVSPDYTLLQVGFKPKENFDILKMEEQIDGYSEFTTQNEKAELVDVSPSVRELLGWADFHNP